MRNTIFARGRRFVVLGVMTVVLTSPLVAEERQRERRLSDARRPNTAALRRAIEDLIATYGEQQYPRGREFLARLAKIESLKVQGGGSTERLRSLHRQALTANPLLKFERLLLVKRDSSSPKLGLPMNWQGNSSLPRTGFHDEIAVLSPVRSDGRLTTLYEPKPGRFVGDVALHYGADRLLFSSMDDRGRWQVFEMTLGDGALRQLTRGQENDVDNYDACYLPGGGIIFSSTACFQGVPCVKGSDHVANLYTMDEKGEAVRRLTFDQDHDWCPTVLENGRILYQRWEYSDIPHFASRLLFQMNPDGTEQRAFYGSNSYWPNSMFYARPIPGRSSKFVAVVSGHHDVPRMGELVLFDAAQGRHETDGALQRIPGHGKKVDAILRDDLVKASWPKFLHPWPLSDKYFIVSAKPTATANWGVYLVDVFDNMLLLKESPGHALFEPIPLRKKKQPPTIPSRIRSERTDATVYMEDVYAGPGLAGVPRGTVKKLRLFTYHFAYHGMGGQVNRVGLDGPWDVKRVLGTVPVEEDGSSAFHIPANTPISVQPLDAEGKALQLMRSWFVGMPGERVSCVGCHEGPRRSPTNKKTIALDKAPAAITSWYGPTRGFSFKREVQPVLDRHCIRCHNDKSQLEKAIVDLRRQPDVHPVAAGNNYNRGTKFSPSYLALRCFVRSPTIESDMHLLTPMDFHADTTRLVKMLLEGHYGVVLDAEAWDRLVTWIDLGAPAHGTWREIVGDELVAPQRKRRLEMQKRYAGRDEDPEAFPQPRLYDPVLTGADTKSSSGEAAAGTGPPAESRRPPPPRDDGRRIRPAVSKQTTQSAPAVRRIDLGGGVELELVLVPAGKFSSDGATNNDVESPVQRVSVMRPFWMGRFEITNRQFRRFDASHDSRLEHGDFLQFSHEERGYPLNRPRQPVCRVSWRQGMAFCDWLSQKTSQNFTLPSELQWEYACRAGSQSPLSYGEISDDFSAYANLGDASLKRVDSFQPWKLPVGAIPRWRPAEERFDDGYRVSAAVGSYQPNAWGLYDMHGNVAEWTRDVFNTSALSVNRNRLAQNDRRVVRGGSWYDRPLHARSAYRSSYWPYQRVFDVGFRVVCEVKVKQAK
ncbi:MAG: SUMF1/EgtB/PvdO family nonheme iron enzyme [Pirellulaceae bacterium]|nr:SUMF1/EgtB/PvdO family nonheme iron enzyme [Pirellulaceae bacterium]